MIVAVIPCRMGSQRIARKNLQPIDGISMVRRACLCAEASRHIDYIVVSTDDTHSISAEVGDIAAVIERPPSICGPKADIADAVEHAVQGLGASHVVTLQPAVLARSPAIVDALVGSVLAENANGGLTMARSVPWQWTVIGATAENAWHPGPYPRSQDAGHRLAEVNAVQVASIGVVEKRERWGLPLVVAELPPWATALDIDTPEDLVEARLLWPFASQRLENLRPRTRIIRDIYKST
jgi:CMP-N,N'-diacetyllegionaminic acid synthase